MVHTKCTGAIPWKWPIPQFFTNERKGQNMYDEQEIWIGDIFEIPSWFSASTFIEFTTGYFSSYV